MLKIMVTFIFYYLVSTEPDLENSTPYPDHLSSWRKQAEGLIKIRSFQ